jgi:CarboxypepD_reg-like domain
MKKQLTRLSFLWSLILSSWSICAQTPVQTIRGQALDKDTREPLTGATVSIQNIEPSIGAICDAEGRFVISNVPVGRHSL